MRDIEAFAAVATCGGFNRAAAHLHVTQSSLSRRIANLEHHIGVPLFVRKSGGVELTAHGGTLLARSNDLLRQHEHLQAEILSLAGKPQGVLAMGVPPSLLAEGSAAIALLRERYPDLAVRVWVATTVDLQAMLLEEKLDFAIYAATDSDSRVDISPLFEDRLYVMTAKASAQQSATMSWEEIGKLPLVLPSRPNSVRRMVETAAANHGITINLVTEVNDVQLILRLVEMNAGSTILPFSAVRCCDPEKFLLSRVSGLKITWVTATVRGRLRTVACSKAMEIVQQVFCGGSGPRR